MTFNKSTGALTIGLIALSLWFARKAQASTREAEEADRRLRHELSEREGARIELESARNAVLESERLKSEFLANISHEIRTPMNGIIGMTDLLLHTRLSDEQLHFAERISSSSLLLLNVIDDILDLSRAEAGQLPFEHLSFDLNHVLDGVIERFIKSAHAKQLTLTASVASDVPTALCGDPGRLRQVLTNIIDNAVKFTEQGSIIVRITSEHETQDIVVLRFAVHDSGIGVPARARKRLFEPFVQADGTTTRRHGGMGLGLSIAKQLVEKMSGEIGAQFTPTGVGSTFWFTVPLEKLREAEVTLRPRTGLGGLRVLVAESNDASRHALVQQTELWGMPTTETTSAGSALATMLHAAQEDAPFDFVLLDTQLPDLDGFGLARAIKADARIARARLILVPSLTERGQALSARLAGFAAYLPKPVRSEQLYSCLLMLVNEIPETAPSGETHAPLVTRHLLSETPARLGATLLIVEDSETNQDVLTQMLRLLGCAADVAGDGYLALEAIAKKNYDIVLMDCQMPGMDGYETTRRIRQHESAKRHIPIIALTGYALEGEREKCLMAGMDEYLTKPVEIDRLRAIIQKWLTPKGSAETSDGLRKDGSPPPVDLKRLRRISGGASDGLRRMFDNYLQQMAGELSSLKVAINERSADEVWRRAHTCAGASAVCGMTALVAPLLELENLGRTDNLDRADELYTQVETEFERIKEYLTEQLG